MLKKVIGGTLLTGLIGVLVFGAINRTLDKTGKVAEAQGQGYGRGRSTEALYDTGGLSQDGAGPNSAQRDQASRPEWAGAGRNRTDQTGNSQAQIAAWLQLLGSVVSVDADALVIQTADGEQIAVENRPWSFAQEQGFSAKLNDELTLTGFYEGEEFEVGRIEDATNGQTVVLRDESGRPMWAGRGRRGL